MDPTSAVALGGQGGRTPNDRLCSHFIVLNILLLEHHATTRKKTMMKKEIIMFKHRPTSNSPLMILRFFAKSLATNCCTLI